LKEDQTLMFDELMLDFSKSTPLKNK
jgi:hypothetical protein